MSRGARILVVDDEPQLLRSLRTTLAAHGYDVQTASSGEEALGLVAARAPDLVVLDLVLPGLSGIEVCHRLRARSSLPILVLSARGDERDKVLALDVGADDYLTKPFGVNELLARIRAALRRAAGAHGEVTLGGAVVRLTPTEFDLLKTLATHVGRVLTHGYLLGAVWGPEYAGESQVLRVFIGQLRRKIEDNPSLPRRIVTEPGVGYRLRGDD